MLFFRLTFDSLLSALLYVDVGLFLNNGLLLFTRILVFIAFLYMIIILPITLMAIPNMADNNSRLSSAFKFQEIINKIRHKGWINLIIWYVAIGIVYLIIIIANNFIANIFLILNQYFIGQILQSFTLSPILHIFFYRSIALFYKSE